MGYTNDWEDNAWHEEFVKRRPTNAHVIVTDGIGSILLIRDIKNGKWGYPGGFVDRKDRSALAAAKREFWEETGVALPRLRNLREVSGLEQTTKIYVGQTNANFQQLISVDGTIHPSRGRSLEADWWYMANV